MNSKKIREFVLSLGITPDLLTFRYIISAIELLLNQNGKAIPRVDKIEPLCNILGVGYDNIKWNA